VIGSGTPALDTAPPSAPIDDAALDQLADVMLHARGTLVLTGAGCSTESGVPDYRGPAGAYVVSNHKPMTHQQVCSGCWQVGCLNDGHWVMMATGCKLSCCCC
jgi:hypothetical protein